MADFQPPPPVALKAAVHDPATWTVTLILDLPPGNNSYGVSIERISDNTTITPPIDLEGNPYLFDTSVNVYPN